jgi:DNA-binding response OmpR family regulator
MVRVLVVEDQRELAETVAAGLRREGMAVDIALDGASALHRTYVNEYDVIVLDRGLPGIHGDEVCKTLVTEENPARVLMLSAAAAVEDRVDGLVTGADDYLAKPFAFTELIARVRALARRSQPALPPVLTYGDLNLDPGRRVVRRGGQRLDLSPKEFSVLELLLAADGRAIPAEELLEKAWDEAADPFTNTVKVTISRLRRKLGDPPLIETIPQVGYRMATR